METIIAIVDSIKQLAGIEKINNPYLIAFVLIFGAIAWLFTKPTEAAGWKDILFKDKTDYLKKAKEMFVATNEEHLFYDEAMQQEIFYRLIGIRCCKDNRRTYQRLVIDGIASTTGIRHAYIFIHNTNSNIEIRFSWLDWIEAIIHAVLLLFGALGITIILMDLSRNFTLSTLPSRLFSLSIVTSCYYIALKGLMSMLSARAIKKRLKEFEGKKKEGADALPEQTAAACEQKQQAA